MLDIEWLDKRGSAQGAAQQPFVMVLQNWLPWVWGPKEHGWSAQKKTFAAAPKVEKEVPWVQATVWWRVMTYNAATGPHTQEVINFWVACGSATTMNEGTQLFKKEDAERLYASMEW